MQGLDEKTAEELISLNVAAIRELYETAQVTMARKHRLIAVTTRLLTRPVSVIVLMGLVAAWVVANRAVPTPFDPPPYAFLQGILTLGAFLTTIMVVANQRQQAWLSEQRGHLELQINLLAEHKIAKLIALVEELRRDLPNVPDRVDPVAETMKQPTAPTDVLDALQRRPSWEQ